MIVKARYRKCPVMSSKLFIDVSLRRLSQDGSDFSGMGLFQRMRLDNNIDKKPYLLVALPLWVPHKYGCFIIYKKLCQISGAGVPSFVLRAKLKPAH